MKVNCKIKEIKSGQGYMHIQIMCKSKKFNKYYDVLIKKDEFLNMDKETFLEKIVVDLKNQIKGYIQMFNKREEITSKIKEFENIAFEFDMEEDEL